jgi:nucleoside 2-deoxyribosyltransferase
MRIYLAAPVFSQVQRQYNRRLAEALTARLPRCEIVLPQDFRLGPGGASFNDRRRLAAIYQLCTEAIRGADMVMALLDGADADSGVAFEVGYARGTGKPVLGVRTDYRQLQIKGLNVMLAEGCTDVLCHFSFDERLDSLVEAIVPHLERLAERPRTSTPNATGKRTRTGK